VLFSCGTKWGRDACPQPGVPAWGPRAIRPRKRASLLSAPSTGADLLGISGIWFSSPLPQPDSIPPNIAPCRLLFPIPAPSQTIVAHSAILSPPIHPAHDRQLCLQKSSSNLPFHPSSHFLLPGTFHSSHPAQLTHQGSWSQVLIHMAPFPSAFCPYQSVCHRGLA
jgi:hypothetical protein